MTTPLFWKACDFCESFYLTLLQYPTCIVLNSRKEQAVLIKPKSTVVASSLYVGCMLITLFFTLDVIYEFLIEQTLFLNRYEFLSSVFLLLIISLCLGLILVILPNLSVLFEQYINSLLKFEKQISSREKFGVSGISLTTIIFKGKNNVQWQINKFVITNCFAYFCRSKEFNQGSLHRYDRCHHIGHNFCIASNGHLLGPRSNSS